MAYTEMQSASNRIGRNSGAGPAGVTEVLPTEREAARGLKPFSLREPHRWRRLGIGAGAGAGALALLGAGAVWYQAHHRPRGFRARFGHLVGRA